MSNIYIQEPPTSGKVLLKTSVGDIDIELWARECPKTCRNFIQLCQEGYFNDTIFHRVVKGFIVQGKYIKLYPKHSGDPNGDGTGGSSIYGSPFKDEFHSRLRYVRRGLVGMANSGKDDNGSQFFFTLAATPELQNKNTLFGKVTGVTLFNMLKLEDGLVDHHERPLYPQKIFSAEILNNPFDDIIPRKIRKAEKKENKKKPKEKGIKQFGLLSFGQEAEEDEEETKTFVQNNARKAKSIHDAVDDPSLSKDAIKVMSLEQSSDDDLEEDRDFKCDKQEKELSEDCLNKTRDKLKSRKDLLRDIKKELPEKRENSDSDNDTLMTCEEEKRIKNEKKKVEIRQEILTLKKQYQADRKIKNELLNNKTEKESTNTMISSAANNEMIRDFLEEKEKYGSLKANLPKKGASREDFTLNLLAKFRSKLNALKTEKDPGEYNKKSSADEKTIEQEINGDEWLLHSLKFEDIRPVLAKDASTKDDDWYDAYDPRNPLNKRKRGEHRNASKDRTRPKQKR